MTRRGEAAAAPDRVVLTGGPLGVAEVVAVARRRVPVELGEEGRKRMAAARDVVERAVAEGRRVYGVSTGFGLLARAVRSVLDGTAQPYDNLDAIDVAELRTLTRDLGDTAGLIGGLEASSRELVDLAGRLDETQAAIPVPVRILDGDQLVVDNPLPVRSLLNIQARRHLPMHHAQLSELLEPSS